MSATYIKPEKRVVGKCFVCEEPKEIKYQDGEAGICQECASEYFAASTAMRQSEKAQQINERHEVQ